MAVVSLPLPPPLQSHRAVVDQALLLLYANVAYLFQMDDDDGNNNSTCDNHHVSFYSVTVEYLSVCVCVKYFVDCHLQTSVVSSAVVKSYNMKKNNTM